MTLNASLESHGSRWLYQTLTIGAAVAIFLIDTFTTLDIAIAVLYAVVVMVSARYLPMAGVLAVAALCAAMTLLGYLIAHGLAFDTGPSIRALISLSAIAVTTFLTLQNLAATQRLADQASLLDMTHDSIIVRDMGGIITYWNAAAADLYGWTREEAIGRTASELLKSRLSTSLDNILEVLNRSGYWNGEVVHTTRSGAEVVVATRWSFYRDSRGHPVGILTTNNDITEQRRTEDVASALRAELSHVARVSTLGELTASIAHEVNQPLAAVVANGDAGLRWLSRDVPDLAEVRTAMERMIKNGRRASEVISRLRALARKDEGKRTEFTLNEVVEDILPLLEREIAKHAIVIDQELRPEAPVLHGDRVQLQQVVINLVLNAIQSMAGIDGRERRLSIRSGREEGETGEVAVLEVEDTGPGIDAANASALFKPFYTTKADGMGMGLSICRTIVEAHDGVIHVTAGKSRGASFLVSIPTTHEAQA